MRKLTRAVLLGMTASTLALTGCATNSACQDCDTDAVACCGDPDCDGECQAATVGAANDTCPFSGEPVNASIETVSFGGREVGFCCAGCASKFAKMTDEEKASLLGG